MKVDTKAILTVEADAVEQVGQEYVELFLNEGYMTQEELNELYAVYMNTDYTDVRVFFGKAHIDSFILSACTMVTHVVFERGARTIETIEGIMPIMGRVKVGIIDDMKNLDNRAEETYKNDRGYFDWNSLAVTESTAYNSNKYLQYEEKFSPKKRYLNVFIPQSRLK